MDIAVLGTGVSGQTIGSKLIQLGHKVMMGSRQEAHPAAVEWAKKEERDAFFGTFAEAAEFGELIFNCTLGTATLEALRMAGADNMRGKILVDLTNPLEYSEDATEVLTVCNTDSLGEQIQREFPLTKVVKTLNTVNMTVMVDPEKLAERTDVFLSGNSADAKAKVAKFLRDFGWTHIIDLGDITTSRGVEMYVILWRSLRETLSSHRFNIKVVTE